MFRTINITSLTRECSWWYNLGSVYNYILIMLRRLRGNYWNNSGYSEVRLGSSVRGQGGSRQVRLLHTHTHTFRSVTVKCKTYFSSWCRMRFPQHGDQRGTGVVARQAWHVMHVPAPPETSHSGVVVVALVTTPQPRVPLRCTSVDRRTSLS